MDAKKSVGHLSIVEIDRRFRENRFQAFLGFCLLPVLMGQAFNHASHEVLNRWDSLRGFVWVWQFATRLA